MKFKLLCAGIAALGIYGAAPANADTIPFLPTWNAYDQVVGLGNFFPETFTATATGTVLVTDLYVPGDGYEIFDLKGNKTDEFKVGKQTSSADLIGRDSMTDAHFANFIGGIRHGDKLNAPIAVGNVAVTMLQLSNIAWEVNRELRLDLADGKIQNDSQAMEMWGRKYEQDWAPQI